MRVPASSHGRPRRVAGRSRMSKDQRGKEAARAVLRHGSRSQEVDVPLLRTTRRRFVGRRGRLEQGRLERARETGAHGLERAREAVTPAVEQVREAAAPPLALAKEKIVDEVLPRVGASVAAALAASEPVREEAKRRGSATVAALKGDLEPPAPPRRKRRLGKFL